MFLPVLLEPHLSPFSFIQPLQVQKSRIHPPILLPMRQALLVFGREGLSAQPTLAIFFFFLQGGVSSAVVSIPSTAPQVFVSRRKQGSSPGVGLPPYLLVPQQQLFVAPHQEGSLPSCLQLGGCVGGLNSLARETLRSLLAPAGLPSGLQTQQLQAAFYGYPPAQSEYAGHMVRTRP